MQGFLFRGHQWYYCTGCGNPTVNQCCGPLQPWNQNIHGHLPSAIQAAHQGGHRLGYNPGYGGHSDFGSFLGTLMMVDGLADGDLGEVMVGGMLGGGGGMGATSSWEQQSS